MAFNDPLFFELSEDHLKLLSNFYITWQDSYNGAPEVNPKRPYGDSMILNSICEILGWETEEEYLEEDEDLMDEAFAIHKEMETVLQILVDNATIGISPGKYKGEWNWKKIE